MRISAQTQPQPQQRAFSNRVGSPLPHPAASHQAIPFLQWQRTLGNQAVQRLLQAQMDHHEACASNAVGTLSAHDVSRGATPAQSPGNLQAKLSISSPGDKYEAEADRVAEQVMRMPESRLQRTCTCGGDCPTCQPARLGQNQWDTTWCLVLVGSRLGCTRAGSCSPMNSPMWCSSQGKVGGMVVQAMHHLACLLFAYSGSYPPNQRLDTRIHLDLNLDADAREKKIQELGWNNDLSADAYKKLTLEKYGMEQLPGSVDSLWPGAIAAIEGKGLAPDYR